MTVYLELDFRSENLFCTRFVATDLVTSIELNLILCATMLCHFGQTRNGSMDNLSILPSNTETSSATGGYLVFPERLGQNEEPASSTKERTRKKPSLSSQMCS